MSIHLYTNPAFATSERPGAPVYGNYGFHMGAGTALVDLLYPRLANMKQATPESAKAFIAFLTPYRPPFIKDWSVSDEASMRLLGPDRVDYMPNTMRMTIIQMCRQLSNATYLRTLMPHLRHDTRHRHFLMLPFEPFTCRGEAMVQQRSGVTVPKHMVPGEPLLKFVRMALALDFDNLVAKHGIHERPFHLQLPYISSVRWDPAWEQPTAATVRGSSSALAGYPPWKGALHGERRQLLVAFTGSLRGHPDSVRLRKALVLQCARVPNSVCTSHVDESYALLPPSELSATPTEQRTLRRALRLKRHAVFCLEPPGFSPPRKSMIDSMLSGCVPVLFYEDDAYPSLLAYYLGEWGANASVRVDRSAVLRGDLDLMKHLATLPVERVRAMQRSLALHAHTLAYGLGPRGLPGDAIERLVGLLAAAPDDPKVSQ